MKKLIIFIVITVFLTGCDSTEVFEKECSQTIDSENTKYQENIKFIYNNKDEVLNIIVTKNYNSDSELYLIKESANSYNNALSKNEYVKIRIISDTDKEYIVEYNYDVTKMTDSDVKQFDINKNWIKLNNKIRESNIKCK